MRTAYAARASEALTPSPLPLRGRGATDGRKGTPDRPCPAPVPPRGRGEGVRASEARSAQRVGRGNG